jgi:hyperosmotically inducible periplasmic protein
MERNVNMNAKIRWYIGASLVAAALSSAAVAFAQPAAQTAADLKKRVEKSYYRTFTAPIDISVSKMGTVLLKGSVNTFWEKYNIYLTVAKVPGVKEVMTDIDVTTDPVPDNIIKDEILNQYRITRSILEPEKITVQVKNGNVTLGGKVNFYKEELIAFDIAGWWRGVKDVDSDIEIIPPARAESDSGLTEIVTDVLKNDFSLGAKKVKVQVVNGFVTLTGTIGDPWLKHSIESQIHGILGVRQVVNQLKVE